MLKIILAASVALMLTACGTTQPVPGALYADVKGPVGATRLTQGKKEGQACATSYLGLVATGDASIATAAEMGGVKKVTAVDHHSTNILGIVTTYCTIVRGHGGKR